MAFSHCLQTALLLGDYEVRRFHNTQLSPESPGIFYQFPTLQHTLQKKRQDQPSLGLPT